jgi:ArsR family metal-binding transcriptional regulator
MLVSELDLKYLRKGDRVSCIHGPYKGTIDSIKTEAHWKDIPQEIKDWVSVHWDNGHKALYEHKRCEFIELIRPTT